MQLSQKDKVRHLVIDVKPEKRLLGRIGITPHAHGWEFRFTRFPPVMLSLPQSRTSEEVAFGGPKGFLALTTWALGAENQRGLGLYGRGRGGIGGVASGGPILGLRTEKVGPMWGAA